MRIPKQENLYFLEPYLDNLLSRSLFVIFDLNGLIIDDEAEQLSSVNLVLKPSGIHIDEKQWIASCLGKKADQYFCEILKENNVDPDTRLVMNLVEDKNRLYRSIISEKVKELTRPGVLELIDFMYLETSKKLGLATSALPLEVDTILGTKGLNILSRFEYIVSGDDVEQGKPNPDIYIKISSISKIPVSRCLVFEDSRIGAEAAYNAGMTCIAVPNRFTRLQNFDHATCVINNLTREARILKNQG